MTRMAWVLALALAWAGGAPHAVARVVGTRSAAAAAPPLADELHAQRHAGAEAMCRAAALGRPVGRGAGAAAEKSEAARGARRDDWRDDPSPAGGCGRTSAASGDSIALASRQAVPPVKAGAAMPTGIGVMSRPLRLRRLWRRQPPPLWRMLRMLRLIGIGCTVIPMRPPLPQDGGRLPQNLRDGGAARDVGGAAGTSCRALPCWLSSGSLPPHSRSARAGSRPGAAPAAFRLPSRAGGLLWRVLVLLLLSVAGELPCARRSCAARRGAGRRSARHLRARTVYARAVAFCVAIAVASVPVVDSCGAGLYCEQEQGCNNGNDNGCAACEPGQYMAETSHTNTACASCVDGYTTSSETTSAGDCIVCPDTCESGCDPRYMFTSCPATVIDSWPADWITSASITNLRGMFAGATSFSSDISGWNVAQVTVMRATFKGATSFTSDLSAWQVGQVTTMHTMFNGATSFTSDLSAWQVGQVTTMHMMFNGATSFSSDLSGWQVGQVTTMKRMFRGATSFTSDLSAWQVGQVTNMQNMFQNSAMGIDFRAPTGPWDVSGISTTDMYSGSCLESPAACTGVVCTQPSDITGYSVTETQLNVAAGFAVTVACASNYESIGSGPAAASCGAASGDYTLSGCAAVVCSQPSDVSGYTIGAEQLDLSAGAFAVTVSCAGGYESSGSGPAAASCGAASGDYTLSGCAAIVCTRPSDMTGYTVVTETQLSVVMGFDVTVACATNYEGDSPAATACESSGAYTLSGCAAIVCTQPSDITGYSVTETQLDTAVGFDVTVVCASNYESSGSGPAAASCGV
jgi:surface protein